MLKLVSTAINPDIGLKSAVENWISIARRLRESKRERTYQLDHLANF